MPVTLLIGIFVLGTAAVWLLALLPAAGITALKGRWDLFAWGFLTAGILWFAGALSLAPADSRWARRSYDDDLLARAKQPFRAQRPSRTFAAWATVLVALITAIGSFAMRPSPLLGVSGTAIGNSVPGRGGGLVFEVWPHLGPCQQRGPDSWRCMVYDNEGSGGTVEYRVDVRGLGCWTAKPTRRSEEGDLAGCLTLFDYLT